MLVPFLLVLFLFGIALGIFAAGMVLRLGPAAEWFVWPIPALLSPFVAVFYPLAMLPQWMQYLSYVLPPSYVFESMRPILAGAARLASGPAVGRIPGRPVHLPRLLVLRPHLPPRPPHRPDRPLQRRNAELTTSSKRRMAAFRSIPGGCRSLTECPIDSILML